MGQWDCLLAALHLDGGLLYHLGQVVIANISPCVDVPGAMDKLAVTAILDDHLVRYLARVAVGVVIVNIDFVSSVLPEADILHPSALHATGVSACQSVHVQVYLAILTYFIAVLDNLPSGDNLGVDIQVRSAHPG